MVAPNGNQKVSQLPTPAQVAENPARKWEVVQWVNMFVLESWNVESNWGIADAADNNLHLFLKARTRDVNQSTFYGAALIQVACMSSTAVQVGDMPKTKFLPAESGEPPVCYINNTPQYTSSVDLLLTQLSGTPAGQSQAIDPATGMPAQPAPPINPAAIAAPNGQMPEPLTDQEAQKVRQVIELGRIQKLQAMAMGQPTPQVVPPEVLIEVNDLETASAMQSVFDILAERSNYHYYITETELWKNVYGTQWLLCEFDRAKKCWRFTGSEIGMCHPDPLSSDIRHGQAFEWDQLLPAETAKELYPMFAADIDAYASSGPPAGFGARPYYPTNWLSSFLFRNKVIISHCWVRNQPYPLTPEQALEQQKVISQDVPDEEQISAARQAASAQTDAQSARQTLGVAQDSSFNGAGSPPADTSDEHEPEGDDSVLDQDDERLKNADQASAAGQQQGADLDTGSIDEDAENLGMEAGDAAAATPAPTRTAYYLRMADGNPDLATGEVNAVHPKWPIRWSIRKLTIIANQLVGDNECDRIEIPVGHTKNIPISSCMPWGQGEPERLGGLQAAVNNLITDMVVEENFSAYQSYMGPRSLQTSAPALIANKFNEPGKFFGIPDEIWQKYGEKSLIPITGGKTSPDRFQALNTLLSLFDKTSSFSEAMNGAAPTPNASGELVKSLQAAATNVIKFKNIYTIAMLQHLAHVMRGDILIFFTPEDLAQMIRKYPIHVWYELHRRMRTHMVDSLIEVDIVSTSSEQSEAQKILEAAQASPAGGVQISPQEQYRRLDLDPRTQETEIAEWQRDQAAMAQQVQTQQPGQPIAAGKPQPGGSPQPQQPAGQLGLAIAG